MSFIVLDIETSGLIPDDHGLLSIGAVDYASGAEFYAECALTLGHSADPRAMAVNGFTEEQARDQSKPSGHEIYVRFAAWAKDLGVNLIGGQQVGAFDIAFLHGYAGGKAGFEQTFSHRSVDLHSLAFGRLGKSLSLDGILVALGLTPEPKPHNALTGARLERDAFKLLLESAL